MKLTWWGLKRLIHNKLTFKMYFIIELYEKFTGGRKV